MFCYSYPRRSLEKYGEKLKQGWVLGSYSEFDIGECCYFRSLKLLLLLLLLLLIITYDNSNNNDNDNTVRIIIIIMIYLIILMTIITKITIIPDYYNNNNDNNNNNNNDINNINVKYDDDVNKRRPRIGTMPPMLPPLIFSLLLL